jgi:hypothetical protein
MAKTTTPQIIIHNAETGEVITRNANVDELAQLEADKAIQASADAAKAKADADKAALLARLGLTEDELKTILG